jgi:hypothetical protein
MTTEETNSFESKALRLARYLREFVGLRSTTVRDVSNYESVLWFGEMPHEPECQSPAWSDEFETGDPRLTVHKQQFPRPPPPPEVILPWIDQQGLKRAAAEMPELRRTRLVGFTRLPSAAGSSTVDLCAAVRRSCRAFSV